MRTNLPLRPKRKLTEADYRVMRKYGLSTEKPKKEDFVNQWMSTWSYICYQVEKNTNLCINKDTNLVMVRDRYNSYCYEVDLQNEQYKKASKKK